jgi:hypothetical protein
MENLFETLADITRPINLDNPFGIDYSPYIDCEILNVFSDSLKVKVVGNDDVASISKNYVLYKTMEVGEVVRANKNFLKY